VLVKAVADSGLQDSLKRTRVLARDAIPEWSARRGTRVSSNNRDDRSSSKQQKQQQAAAAASSKQQKQQKQQRQQQRRQQQQQQQQKKKKTLVSLQSLEEKYARRYHVLGAPSCM
jgi:hypothetical protein